MEPVFFGKVSTTYIISTSNIWKDPSQNTIVGKIQLKLLFHGPLAEYVKDHEIEVWTYFFLYTKYVHPQKFKPVSHWRSYHRMDFSSSRWPLSAGASLAMNRSDATACSEVVLFFDLQCQSHRENGGTRSPWDGGSLTINLIGDIPFGQPFVELYFALIFCVNPSSQKAT